MTWIQRIPPIAIDILQASLMLVAGMLAGVLAARIARSFATTRSSPAQADVAARLVLWTVITIAVVSALREVGFDLSIFMGAAGLLTVAVGFASQTSASNLISGLFLLFERPFGIRDTIRIGTTTGEVVSTDLLSVRLRTFDNLLVRVPNETLLKTEITNLSHFPLRRFDLQIVVGFEHDLGQVRAQILELVRRDTRVLDEPEAVAHFVAFLDHGAQFQISVWAVRGSYLQVKNDLPLDVHRGLAALGVQMPIPPRRIQVGPVP